MFMLRQTSVKMAVLLHKQANDWFHPLLSVWLFGRAKWPVQLVDGSGGSSKQLYLVEYELRFMCSAHIVQ